MMRGSHYGNVIKHLEVAHLSELPVPVLDRLIDEIHEQVTGGVDRHGTRRTNWTQLRGTWFAEAMEDQPELGVRRGLYRSCIPTLRGTSQAGSECT